MFAIGPIGFTAPWLLVPLIALPILWLILRAVPPAPVRRLFPGVALLLGLQDEDQQSDKTPWWLLLLRILAVAAVIVGFAGPILNPTKDTAGTGPVLIVMDGTWADARNWSQRLDRVDALLREAAREGRPAAVTVLTNPAPLDSTFQAADVWLSRLPSLTPHPWEPDAQTIEAWLDSLSGDFDTVWLSDGLDRPNRTRVLEALEARGSVSVLQAGTATLALLPPQFEDGVLNIEGRRVGQGAATYTVEAHGLDPAGIERVLSTVDLSFEAQETDAKVALSLPAELRNRISRFELRGIRSAGAISLTDDSLRRREIALFAGREDREGLELLSPLHYLSQALAENADLVDGSFGDILLANPDVIILADVAKVGPDEELGLLEWVAKGGLLLRFAGPRLAASDVSRTVEDPLMPVRLRSGGRTVGGAMSWGTPKTLSAFDPDSPFFGLTIPEDVTVSAQVMAQPDPNLAERVIAGLADGTPLVTRKKLDAGQIVLMHVTANAEWSSLPLSGLFVQMLDRLAISSTPSQPEAQDLTGTQWTPVQVLDAFGALRPADTLRGVAGEDLVTQPLGADQQPGLYDGEDRRLALNVARPDMQLGPQVWPSSVSVEGLSVVAETALKGWLLFAALALFAVDAIASLFVGGRLTGARAKASSGVAIMVLASLAYGGPAEAQTNDDAYLTATSEVVLAHVLTGDATIDQTTRAGLVGLSDTLFRRTSIEPANPISIDLERDEISLFPFLYWPITPDQATPSAAAYAKLNRYLRTGGMILFDTRDADTARFGASSPNGRKLQALAASLDIPPIEPIPGDHVLTRTFYLLQDFPGRFASREVWVEAAPPDAEQAEGMPFRNLNDGVTPVVIGGNDWAAAWAVDNAGNRMFPVGRGYNGERQREIALRFGVNLIMHVLTGNYKSDQVHVPALLDRLGQ
ncbi:DUF4159 domain-containing protein [Algirhabdus cladophorae]|uniref:DUF4159 domain-containing protein n=1 Tax=Algirhabdus cladophorae TaxID=3377108 RepID=UPI003B848D69